MHSYGTSIPTRMTAVVGATGSSTVISSSSTSASYHHKHHLVANCPQMVRRHRQRSSHGRRHGHATRHQAEARAKPHSTVTKSVSTCTVCSIECRAPSECYCDVAQTYLACNSHLCNFTTTTTSTCTATHIASAQTNRNRNLFDTFQYETRSRKKAIEDEASRKKEHGFQVIDRSTGVAHGVVEIHNPGRHMIEITGTLSVEPPDLALSVTGTTSFPLPDETSHQITCTNLLMPKSPSTDGTTIAPCELAPVSTGRSTRMTSFPLPGETSHQTRDMLTPKSPSTTMSVRGPVLSDDTSHKTRDCVILESPTTFAQRSPFGGTSQWPFKVPSAPAARPTKRGLSSGYDEEYDAYSNAKKARFDGGTMDSIIKPNVPITKPSYVLLDRLQPDTQYYNDGNKSGTFDVQTTRVDGVPRVKWVSFPKRKPTASVGRSPDNDAIDGGSKDVTLDVNRNYVTKDFPDIVSRLSLGKDTDTEIIQLDGTNSNRGLQKPRDKDVNARNSDDDIVCLSTVKRTVYPETAHSSRHTVHTTSYADGLHVNERSFHTHAGLNNSAVCPGSLQMNRNPTAYTSGDVAEDVIHIDSTITDKASERDYVTGTVDDSGYIPTGGDGSESVVEVSLDKIATLNRVEGSSNAQTVETGNERKWLYVKKDHSHAQDVCNEGDGIYSNAKKVQIDGGTMRNIIKPEDDDNKDNCYFIGLSNEDIARMVENAVNSKKRKYVEISDDDDDDDDDTDEDDEESIEDLTEKPPKPYYLTKEFQEAYHRSLDDDDGRGDFFYEDFGEMDSEEDDESSDEVEEEEELEDDDDSEDLEGDEEENFKNEKVPNPEKLQTATNDEVITTNISSEYYVPDAAKLRKIQELKSLIRTMCETDEETKAWVQDYLTKELGESGRNDDSVSRSTGVVHGTVEIHSPGPYMSETSSVEPAYLASSATGTTFPLPDVSSMAQENTKGFNHDNCVTDSGNSVNREDSRKARGNMKYGAVEPVIEGNASNEQCSMNSQDICNRKAHGNMSESVIQSGASDGEWVINGNYLSRNNLGSTTDRNVMWRSSIAHVTVYETASESTTGVTTLNVDCTISEQNFVNDFERMPENTSESVVEVGASHSKWSLSRNPITEDDNRKAHKNTSESMIEVGGGAQWNASRSTVVVPSKTTVSLCSDSTTSTNSNSTVECTSTGNCNGRVQDSAIAGCSHRLDRDYHGSTGIVVLPHISNSQEVISICRGNSLVTVGSSTDRNIAHHTQDYHQTESSSKSPRGAPMPQPGQPTVTTIRRDRSLVATGSSDSLVRFTKQDRKQMENPSGPQRFGAPVLQPGQPTVTFRRYAPDPNTPHCKLTWDCNTTGIVVPLSLLCKASDHCIPFRRSTSIEQPISGMMETIPSQTFSDGANTPTVKSITKLLISDRVAGTQIDNASNLAVNETENSITDITLQSDSRSKEDRTLSIGASQDRNTQMVRCTQSQLVSCRNNGKGKTLVSNGGTWENNRNSGMVQCTQHQIDSKDCRGAIMDTDALPSCSKLHDVNNTDDDCIVISSEDESSGPEITEVRNAPSVTAPSTGIKNMTGNPEVENAVSCSTVMSSYEMTRWRRRKELKCMLTEKLSSLTCEIFREGSPNKTTNTKTASESATPMDSLETQPTNGRRPRRSSQDVRNLSSESVVEITSEVSVESQKPKAQLEICTESDEKNKGIGRKDESQVNVCLPMEGTWSRESRARVLDKTVVDSDSECHALGLPFKSRGKSLGNDSTVLDKSADKEPAALSLTNHSVVLNSSANRIAAALSLVNQTVVLDKAANRAGEHLSKLSSNKVNTNVSTEQPDLKQV